MKEEKERIRHAKENRQNILDIFGKVIGIGLWVALIIVCVVNRDKITAEGIVGLVPKDSVLSIIVMLLLFAVKGVAVFIYGSILYAASGILFSLPVAIIVNTIGTVIMTTIPFYIGKKAGSRLLGELVKKNSKLELLRDTQNKNEFFVSFFLRMVGLLPADLVAMYFGASGMCYNPYFFGTVIGLLPAIICFSVMGMSIDDIGSPQFLISLIVEVGLMLLSLLIYFIWKLKSKRKRDDETNEA